MKRRTIKNVESRKTGPVTNGTRNGANRIRAALALRGLTFASWARRHGYSLPTVWTAAYRLRGGKVARKIQAELEQLLDA